MVTTRQKKKRKRERVSAKRRVDSHATGGDSNYLKIPEGYSFFKVKAKKYRLDFRSFRAGKGNPFADKGDLHYERTFWVHRDIGPNKDWHLCAAKTLNQPCPVCEYRAKLARDPNSDEAMIKDLSPKERQLWLPVDLDADDEEKLIWEFSYHLFGKQLDKKIKSGDEEDEYEFFADPEEGMTVRVVFDQSEHGKWVEASDIEFKPRRKQYDEEDSDGLPCLDDVLVATPYNKLKALFLQTDEADEAEEDDDDDDGEDKKKSRKERSRKPDPDEDDDTTTAEDAGLEEGDKVVFVDDEDGVGECEIVRISGDGTSLTLEDSDGDTHKGIGCDEVEKAKPKPKAKAKRKKKPEPESEPDEDEDADPDDEDGIPFDGDGEREEKPKKSKSKKAQTKPKKKKKPDDDNEGDGDGDWDEDW